jgi:hypothetical protein
MRSFPSLHFYRSRSNPSFLLAELLPPRPLGLDASQFWQSLFLDRSWIRHGSRIGREVVRRQPPVSYWLQDRLLNFLLFFCSLEPYDDCDTFISTGPFKTFLRFCLSLLESVRC